MNLGSCLTICKWFDLKKLTLPKSSRFDWLIKSHLCKMDKAESQNKVLAKKKYFIRGNESLLDILLRDYTNNIDTGCLYYKRFKKFNLFLLLTATPYFDTSNKHDLFFNTIHAHIHNEKPYQEHADQRHDLERSISFWKILLIFSWKKILIKGQSMEFKMNICYTYFRFVIVVFPERFLL